MKRLIFTMMAESLNKSLPIASSAGGAIVCSVSFRSLFISFVWQRYGKRHKKALGRAWKSGAEGESLKLLKESGAIFSLRT